MLDWVPAQLRVVRVCRPKYACRSCGTITQAPGARTTDRRRFGYASPARTGAGHPITATTHTALYRQAQILARHGIELERSTLAGWVGGACWWFEALHDRLCKHMFASDHLFADDTPIPVFDPGRGRTKTGRLWVYTRDQRGWGGPSRRLRILCSRPTGKRNVRQRI